MTHVLFIQSNPVFGGCEDYFSMLIRGLSAEGVRVTLLCPDAPAIERLREEVSGHAEVVQFRSASSGLQAVSALVRQIRKIRPDIAHLNDPGLLAMTSARLACVPIKVVTIHTPRQIFSYNRKARLLRNWVFRGNWHVIAVSESNREMLCGQYGLRPEMVHPITHGLDPSRFVNACSRGEVRQEFGISPEAFLLGIVGRLVPQKNHQLLFQAIAGLPLTCRQKLVLLVVGDGDLLPKLEEECRILGLSEQVIFAKHRADVPRLLSAMDTFILTSDYEGLPFAVLEAMAMALPVLSTSVDGVKDAVVDGETGILFPPRNLEAVVAALKEILEDPEKARLMGNAGRKRFLDRYTLDHMVRATNALYRSIPENE